MKTCKCCNQTIKENVIQEIPAKRLEWGETCDKELTWKDAKKWCEKQGKGWRLPTRLELMEAFEAKIDGFQSGYYWSSTEYNTNFAWYVVFSNGGSNFNLKNFSYYVRAVRG